MPEETPKVEAPKTVVREALVENINVPKTAGVQIVAMPWWKMIGVRALRVYIQSLLGFLTAATTGAAAAAGVQMPVGDFSQLFVACLSLAVAPAVFSLLQNSAEILGGLDVSNPKLRA